MKKQLTHTLMAAIATATLLSGCGQSVLAPGLSGQASAGIQAQSTKTLLNSFKHIHVALFTKMDANKDKRVDEYEASPTMDLRDFASADRTRDGKLTMSEFMNYATGGSKFAFLRQDKNDFMKQARNAIAKGFKKLDKDKDGVLIREEMSNEALKKVGLNLTIDGLKTRVVIEEFDLEFFTRHDRTGDKALSQAEFEDFVMDTFLYLINPEYNPHITPAEPEPAPEPEV